MINIRLIPERNAALVDKNNKLSVLVSISSIFKKMGRPERHTTPLNLGLAIDCSASMQGRPLLEAKRCAHKIVDRMRSSDRLSIIAYSQTSEIIVKNTFVTNKKSIKVQISGIHEQGMTALYDGWDGAASQLLQKAENSNFSRILLLSDGAANQGITDVATISAACAKLADRGVSTSTYGLGEHFNEGLMAKMARSGQGRAHYGQTADDLMEPFQEEFEVIEALVAKKLRLRISPETGVRVKDLNEYSIDEFDRLILPDLPEEGDVWVLIEVTISDAITSQLVGNKIKLLTASLEYQDMAGVDHQSDPVSLSLDIVGPFAFEAIVPDELVQTRFRELQAAKLQEEAGIAAQTGDWAKVNSLIEDLKTLGKDNEWLLNSLSRLEKYARAQQSELFSKEASYKAQNMRYRHASTDESPRSFSASIEYSTKPSFLRRKLEQGKRLNHD